MHSVPRRKFLACVTSGGLVANLLRQFPAPSMPLPGRERQTTPDVRFNDEIEPWVRVLEETPHDQVVGVMAKHVMEGRIGYRQFLAAVFLAGIRNIQPRPSVGFKFHAVLVVNSAHLASLDAAEKEKWLPLLWAVDSFKRSQARDVSEGNWTMASVNDARLPSAVRCLDEFRTAMEGWDEERADAATAALSRVHTSDEIFEQFAAYASRDFRSIGHKAIYLANSFRTLETIGWHHAEPVLRSLSYALLNHVGEENPATNDHLADRDGRNNWNLVRRLREDWMAGSDDEGATVELLECLRRGTSTEASQLVFEQLQRGVATTSIYNALFVFASELTMRQPAIVPLHAVTTTNAMHYIFRKVRSPQTRAFVLLQNAAFLPHFLAESQRRGALADRAVEQFIAQEPLPTPSDIPQNVFVELGRSPTVAAQQVFAYLNQGNPVSPLIQQARTQIFLKGDDSHDYKYSSAVLEDYFQIGPAWRDRYFAAALFKMRHAGERTTGLIQQIQQILG